MGQLRRQVGNISTMSLSDGTTTLTLNDSQADEDRMRAALGLAEHPSPSRSADQGSRPGRHGEVPVTVVSARHPAEASDSLRARLATLTDELKVARGERVAAQQALADARQAIQQLQTKLAHAEMAAAEALEAEQKARLAAEARLLEATPAAVPDRSAERPAGAKKRGRPPTRKQVAVEPAEPEPVEWWLPDYKAKAKRALSKT